MRDFSNDFSVWGKNHDHDDRCGNCNQVPAGRKGRVRFRLSRRFGPAHLRRAVQAGQGQAYSGSARAGGGSCGRRILALDTARRCGHGDLRPGSNERGHRHRDGLHGFDSIGGYFGAGADDLYRPGRLPGMRHRGHHPPLRETQFPGQGRERSGLDHQESLLHRQHGAPGAGGHRYSQGHHRREVQVRVSGGGQVALVQPRDQGACRADQEGGPLAAGCQASGDLYRRWRDSVKCGGAPDAPDASAWFSDHHDADGPGRLSRHRPTISRHAGNAWYGRGQHGHAALRRPAGDRYAF